MKTKTLLITAGVFAVAFAAGFGATLVIRGYAGSPAGAGPEPEVRETAVPVPPEAVPEVRTDIVAGNDAIQEGHLPQDSPSAAVTAPEKTADTALSVESVDGPVFSVRDRHYSVTVHAAAGPDRTGDLEYVLQDDSGEVLSSGTSPVISVPQSESGVYYVYVRDAGTGEEGDPYEIKGCRVRKMEKSRLEQICNSGDYTTMRNAEAYELSPSLTLAFEGIPEDSKAASIDDICTRISLGIWSSVAVLEIRYDELNLVEYVKFQVKE